MKATVIGFYLPQFHPTIENNEWYGKGYTEWTNVSKAKPMFKGHKQPILPGELGFYDLRLPQVREQQAELAKKAGLSAFCYWHYWLGRGIQLLNYPMEEVIRTGKPDFPFCLGWANHSWYKKEWNPDLKEMKNTLLAEQTYPDENDIINHFMTMLPVFKDSRYFKVNGRNLFYIYDVVTMPNLKLFKEIWDRLAKDNGLKPFYFVSYASGIKELKHPNHKLCDATNVSFLSEVFGGRGKRALKRYILEKIGSFFKRSFLVEEYSDLIDNLCDPIFKENKIFPTIVPNWDNTARRKGGATVIVNSTPELFGKHCQQVFNMIKDKPNEERIVFLKSWNEWAEGNYLEPDYEWGDRYIVELRKQLNDE